jgi:hypothetical protein
LQTTGSELVGDEVCGGDVARGKVAVNQQLFAVLMDGSEVDARNLLENVEAIGRVTESGADRWSMKVFHGELGKGSAKLRERFVERKSIFGTRFDEDVEIFGHAWLRVNEDSVPTNNDVLNVVSVQCEQQLF